ncbi:MAG: UDP-3-O-(3-hydroxymyristoyl)glucosamine N-acyltransferase [Planctomycetes bacterium]|nr:UDP-3-O-(3-hydroxymyristoyl)glucosamine N-acyltransferase [Planctomycetota bacterium]
MEYRAPAPENSAPLSVGQIAEMVGGSVEGNAEVLISGVQSMEGATADDAVYLSPGAPKAVLHSYQNCRAGLVFAHAGADLKTAVCCIRVPQPALAAALLSQHFHLAQPRLTGIHKHAEVDDRARVGAGVTLHRGVVLGPDVVIGDGCVLHPGVVIYPGVSLGAGCVVHANAVIGSDGFGYEWSGQGHEKVPQIGAVEIGRGVEIGACTTIDRGTFGATRIGDGCIIDNQVQIGHNCQIGRFVVLCAQVGLSGSTEVGDGAILGGRAASVGHLRIGAGVRMAGAAVATKDVPDGMTVGGYPAWDIRLEQRMQARIRRMAR